MTAVEGALIGKSGPDYRVTIVASPGRAKTGRYYADRRVTDKPGAQVYIYCRFGRAAEAGPAIDVSMDG